MKINRAKTALALTAAVTVMALTACGSSGTISSLTDSDSTTSLVEDAAKDTSTVLSGTLSKAESAATSVPEIVPQTVAASTVTTPQASGTALIATPDDEEEENEPVRVSLTGDGSDDAAAVSTESAEEETDSTMELAGTAPAGEVSLLTDETEPTPAPEEESYEPAGEGNTGYVTGDEVNVRSEPDSSDDDNVMFTLFEGDEVTILASEDDWYKIEVDGEVGWIKAGYVE